MGNLFDLLFGATLFTAATSSIRKSDRKRKKRTKEQQLKNNDYVNKAKNTVTQREGSLDRLAPFGSWPFILLQMEWQDDNDLVKFLEDSKAYYSSDYNSILIDSPYDILKVIFKSMDDVVERIEKHIYEHEKRRFKVGIYYPPDE